MVNQTLFRAKPLPKYWDHSAYFHVSRKFNQFQGSFQKINLRLQSNFHSKSNCAQQTKGNKYRTIEQTNKTIVRSKGGNCSENCPPLTLKNIINSLKNKKRKPFIWKTLSKPVECNFDNTPFIQVRIIFFQVFVFLFESLQLLRSVHSNLEDALGDFYIFVCFVFADRKLSLMEKIILILHAMTFL